METLQHCAYNQTRGSFLSLEVAAGDHGFASLDEWMQKLTPDSGAGLWMTPFRGMPAAGVSEPLDLLYLDKDLRVIAAVESFPIFRVPPSIPWPASVLALPTNTIASTQTRRGDELMICTTEEMARLLKQFHDADGSAGAVPEAQEAPASLSEDSARSLGPDTAQAEGPRLEQRPQAVEASAGASARRETKTTKPTRPWLDRWLFPIRRLRIRIREMRHARWRQA